MARKPVRTQSYVAAPKPFRTPALPKAIRNESDPEWRRWFENIEERRRAENDPKRKPIVFSLCQKDGEQSKTIIRRQSEPRPIYSLIKLETRRRGEKRAEDMVLIGEAWEKTVGAEMADETEIYSFNRGILTITVSSSTLLQEIRQFHKNAIISDLRDIWTASIPLVNVVYRLGKLDGQRR